MCIVSCWKPKYTPPSLKNRGDITLLSWALFSAEFGHGPFHSLEALSSLDNKRRQNGIFFSVFNLAFFLTQMCCPDMPAMSSTAWAEASEAECQHMDSSSTNLVHNSVIKSEYRTGHLTHERYSLELMIVIVLSFLQWLQAELLRHRSISLPSDPSEILGI